MPLVKTHQVRKRRQKSRTPTRRRGRKIGGRHSHKRKTTRKGVQGEEAHRDHIEWKPQTAERIKAQVRIHSRSSVLGNPKKIHDFKHECKTSSGYAKDALDRALFKGANEMLRTDVSHFAGEVWDKNGEELASEFLEQRAHFTPNELSAWRKGQIEIDLAVEFLDWVRKQQTEWARSQKRN